MACRRDERLVPCNLTATGQMTDPWFRFPHHPGDDDQPWWVFAQFNRSLRSLMQQPIAEQRAKQSTVPTRARNSPDRSDDGRAAEDMEHTIDQACELVDSEYHANPMQNCVSVVIPVFNEPVTVLTIVERVRQLPIRKQIIVVNDGSTDGTTESLTQLESYEDVQVLHHKVNRGKGAALQTGFSHAAGEFVIVQDADLEYDPTDILKVIEPLISGQADVVYGSRYLDAPEQDPSATHRAGNWMLTQMSNLLTGYRLTDMETCYKAFRRSVLNEIEIKQSRFGFEPEITAKLAWQRIPITEVGISYQCRSREEGKKIGWRDLVNAIYCIGRYGLFPYSPPERQ